MITKINKNVVLRVLIRCPFLMELLQNSNGFIAQNNKG